MTATGLTGRPLARQLSPNPAGSEDTGNGYLIRDGEHAILIGSGRATPAIVVGRAAHARWDTCPCVALPAGVIIYS